MLSQTTICHNAFRPTPKSARAGAPVTVRAKAADEPLAQTMHLMGATMSHLRNSEIFGEGEPAALEFTAAIELPTSRRIMLRDRAALQRMVS
jgi:hypothetical protein